MALTLDATVGGASSNSYVTLAEATTYFEARLNVTDWTGAASDDIRNRALAMATQRIDFEEYMGNRAAETQALKFPRSDLPLIDGVGWESTEIPIDIKTATYELAIYMLGKDMTAANDDQALDALKIGPIGIDFSVSQPSNDKLPPFVTQLLRPYQLSGGMPRVVR